MTNKQYHANDTHSSSSQLKDAVEDVELFYKKYILKEIERKSIPAFDIGTYYHTAILEPENLTKECAVYAGRRAGKDWTEFKAANEEKAIITTSELSQAETLIDATKASPVAMALLAKGDSELSFFGLLNGMPIKVRCDKIFLSKEKSYILDLKSTTGNCKDKFKVQTKVQGYSYDLSAALYMDTINEVIKALKMDVAPVTEFYWTFASKDIGNCVTYKASQKMLATGRAKYTYGMKQIAKYTALNWEFPDELVELDPPKWDSDNWEDDVKEEKTGSKFSKNQPLVKSDLTDLI